jgi:hypothetical protein
VNFAGHGSNREKLHAFRKNPEIACSGAIEKYIKLRSVKTLKPVGQSQPANPGNTKDWKRPKVYKGLSMHEQEFLDKKHE